MGENHLDVLPVESLRRKCAVEFFRRAIDSRYRKRNTVPIAKEVLGMRLLATTLLFSTALFAQEFRGSFSGSVTDAQGAAVAKAKVVATEIRTGAKSEVFSEASGAFTIPFLQPGDYQLSA